MDAENQNEPQWDVALEALLLETHQSGALPLQLNDLQGLAGKHTIRLDDILDTLCRLVEQKRWIYYGPDGNAVKPDRDMSKMLHANHRLNDVQLERFQGTWAPVSST